MKSCYGRFKNSIPSWNVSAAKKLLRKRRLNNEASATKQQPVLKQQAQQTDP